MRKILHVALGRQNVEMEKAISELGETVIIDWTTEPDIDNKIINTCCDFKPDLVFMQIQGGDVIKESTVEKIRNVCDAILINWTGDVREDISWYKQYAKHFHYTLFTSETDAVALNSAGLSSGYLQVGFQDNIYNKEVSPITGSSTVFCANNYPDRFPLSKLRSDIVEFLQSEYNSDFGLYGFGWGSGIENLNSLPQKEAAIYRGAKIGISVSHFNYERYHSDRQLRIIACGCFCLSYHYDGIEKDFIIGQHLDTFKTNDELKQKIDYYLSNKEKREEIANNGQDFVWNNCRWVNRINELKKIIGW